MRYFELEFSQLSEVLRSAKESVHFSESLDERSQASKFRALAMLEVAAGFERFLSRVVDKLNFEISRAGIRKSEVTRTIMSVALNDIFSSIKSVQGVKLIGKRVELFRQLELDHAVDVSFVKSGLLYGGKTPRGEHISLIWSVYSIDQPFSPSQQHILALDSLADSRNEMAHGETSMIQAGRRKTSSDVFNLIEKIDELALHLIAKMDGYLAGEGYRLR